MKDFIVAIDGPAGSGKSSISDIVANKLGFTHVDTGAFFRAVTLEALNRGINLENEDEYSFLDDINVIYKDGKTYVNGKDVSSLIRTGEISRNVSTPAKLKRVREKVIEFERMSSHGKIIMDGRDIGTVVLPNADLKIFLTASNEERARRRFEQNKLMGIESDYNTILKEIIERDKKDSERAIAPLKQAIDAIAIDTTKMSIDEVSNTIIKLINERND
ncbi:MAG: (d)CMP kinase [Acholeplasmatales bacterium]|nr:(d)CMP kinase [Acholeplasmatales bacterium]